MRRVLFGAFPGLLISCILLYSCDGNSSKQFSSKQDSLNFAQAVMQQYPGERVTASTPQDTTAPVRGRTFQAGPGGVVPIDWATVKLYQSNYDKDPQIKAPQGYYYQGFSLDSAAYQTIIKTPSIKSLYLRLGKKPDGSYTIMVLGLDAKGNVMGGDKSNKADGGTNDDTNWDSLKECPDQCPEEPGN
ncbi:MAG: hypothetical protein EOO06_11595 [Chitinophagaceae bacterium]|nr:MAG: hypothetical protein EOO06_11595 [Chitinophagaceae bacterium]